ncbi:MAG: hypothetical protein LC640_05890 [Frankia sp.]|nr:hypothetical protein [Frankia sp.]
MSPRTLRRIVFGFVAGSAAGWATGLLRSPRRVSLDSSAASAARLPQEEFGDPPVPAAVAAAPSLSGTAVTEAGPVDAGVAVQTGTATTTPADAAVAAQTGTPVATPRDEPAGAPRAARKPAAKRAPAKRTAAAKPPRPGAPAAEPAGGAGGDDPA